MINYLLHLIIISVIVEVLTFLLVNEGSIIQEKLWSKVQNFLLKKKLIFLYRLSSCFYCLSFYISLIIGVLVFDYDFMYNSISIFFIYRFSHYLYDLNNLVVKKQFSDISVIEE